MWRTLCGSADAGFPKMLLWVVACIVQMDCNWKPPVRSHVAGIGLLLLQSCLACLRVRMLLCLHMYICIHKGTNAPHGHIEHVLSLLDS